MKTTSPQNANNLNNNNNNHHNLGHVGCGGGGGGGRRGHFVVYWTRTGCCLFSGWFLVLQVTRMHNLVSSPNPTKNHDELSALSVLFPKQQQQQSRFTLVEDVHHIQQQRRKAITTITREKHHLAAVVASHESNATTTSSTATTTSLSHASVPEADSSSPPPPPPVPFTVDILSVGSQSRLDYIQAQRDSFGSHSSVRHFFNVTELDDPNDPHCSTTLKWNDVASISRFCSTNKYNHNNKRNHHKIHSSSWDPQRQFVMKYLSGSFASTTWLSKKTNPAGWLCAQNRPALGLYKVLQHYRSTLQMLQNDTVSSSSMTSSLSLLSSVLPDFLIVMDDDTYYNMELLEQHFSPSYNDGNNNNNNDEANYNYNSDHYNSSIPKGIAGCVVRSPIRSINFTIPFGGFGFIMSRGYLQNLMTPIHCQQQQQQQEVEEGETTVNNATTKDEQRENHENGNHQKGENDNDFQIKNVCVGIHQTNHLNEKPLFRDGMSLVDLLYAYATDQPYTQYKKWTTGFCLHSDWYAYCVFVVGVPVSHAVPEFVEGRVVNA
jgi:hypothetical protein